MRKSSALRADALSFEQNAPSHSSECLQASLWEANFIGRLSGQALVPESSRAKAPSHNNPLPQQ
ncbi:hypothetical protein GCM10007158_11420 [Vreelandella hamiltonii]|uniref:Uncharacterized protein n=1 Tax=Halomonas johnsoniae TaxID=502832 RepID=A0ABQ2WF29_9GAMM|nr:hypothetical protein GCM10007158_11420 [Halomonas johnsoniae]